MKKNRRQEFSRWVTATKNVNSHYFHEKMTQNKSSSMPMENLHLWVTETDCHKWTLIIHFFRLQAQVLWKRDGLLREVFCQGSHCTSKEAVYGHSPISQERRFMDEVIMMSQERRFMDTVWWVKRGGLWTQSDESREVVYGHSLMSQARRFMDTVWWVSIQSFPLPELMWTDPGPGSATGVRKLISAGTKPRTSLCQLPGGEKQKGEALDNLPWKDEIGPSSSLRQLPRGEKQKGEALDNLPGKDGIGPSLSCHQLPGGEKQKGEVLNNLPWKDEIGPTSLCQLPGGEKQKGEALGSLPWKDEIGPSSIRPTLELCSTGNSS